MSVDNEALIARYLLGELSEEQQVEIEDRAFSDQEYLASITAVENDLIDEYVRGELSADDRRRFEKRFLASAERRTRVAFALALRSVVSEAGGQEKKVVQRAWSLRESGFAFFSRLNLAARVAFVAAAILLVAGVARLFVETQRLRRQVTQLQAENQSLELERRRSDESLRQLTETTEANPPGVVSLTLLPGVSRGGSQTPSLVLSKDARLVRLQIGIDPEEQFETFAVELRTVAGQAVWTRDNLSAWSRRGTRAVELTLPATVLKPGAYELRLRGLTDDRAEDVGFYYFNVTKT